MDFSLSKEEQMIQSAARDFSEQVILPLVEQIEAEHACPDEVIEGMAELGFFGLQFSEEYGGSDAGYVAYSLALSEIAASSGSVASLLSAHSLGLAAIDKFGTHEQKLKYMKPATEGKAICSFAFTEPGTGTDPKAITSTAVRDGDDYVINGTKRFISNGTFDGPCVVFAKDDETGRPTGFIIDKNCEGYSVSQNWDKIGNRGADLVDLYLKDVRVPKENLLGELGKGYNILQYAISFGKIGVVSITLGNAITAYNEAFKYATEKLHRGEPISKFQAVKLQLADMYSKLEAAKWTTYRFAWEADRANIRDFARYASSTKIFVCDLCVDIVRTAMEVHGSYGLMEDYRVAKAWREVIIGGIVEGVPNVQKTILASQLLA